MDLSSFKTRFLKGFLNSKKACCDYCPSLQLTGPIQVIHQAKACCDVKGGKNELSFKQGEQIEIIRITDNPEGKWLGRTAKGSCECKFSYDFKVLGVFFKDNIKYANSLKLGVVNREDKNRKI